MTKKQNKTNNLNLLIISGLIVVLVIVLSTYLTMTGFSIQSQDLIEKTIEIEVWANTYVEMQSEENKVLTTVLLDDETEASGIEVEMYLDELLISNNLTNSNGNIFSTFNLSDISSGKHVLKILSQGSPTQYINEIETEIEIEILENNGTKEIIFPQIVEKEVFEEVSEEILIEENETIEINETVKNETLEVFENLECEEFVENILWSSGYSSDLGNTIQYETWYPKYNCTELNIGNCFIGDIELKARFLNNDNSSKKREGSIKISNPDSSICNSPEKGIYEKYLAYESIVKENKKTGKYCGNNKNVDEKCGIGVDMSYNLDCYGIEIYADQYFIVDVFEIKYKLCGEEQK